jgi:hypothetical protein
MRAWKLTHTKFNIFIPARPPNSLYKLQNWTLDFPGFLVN